ncbi:hypothetical protein CsSME_00013932 [Camellia sinensis var. sinensis]
MLEEFQALQNQHTRSLVSLPQGKTVIGCKWAFKIKRNSDGTVARHKHIEVDCHCVRDRVLAKQLVLHYIPAIDQLADIFTKPLSISKFSYRKGKLMLVSPSISLQDMLKIHHQLA